MRTIKVLNFIGLLFVFLLIAGCNMLATIPPFEGEILPHEEILTLNFPSIDPITGNEINIRLGDLGIVNSFSNLTRYKSRTIRSDSSFTYFNRFNIHETGGYYEVVYTNGETYKVRGTTGETSTHFYIDIKQVDNNKFILSLLDKYKIVTGKNSTMLNIKQVADVDALRNDLVFILKNISSKTYELRKSAAIKGEENVSYPVDSVYANFHRKLKLYHLRYKQDSNDDLNNRRGIFNLHGNRLDVEITPYRNGSKVIYSSSIGYVINSKGEVSDALLKSKIEAYKSEIKRIIND